MNIGITGSHLILMILLSIPQLNKPVDAKESLILGVHPYLSQDEIIKKFTPFVDYLTEQTNMKIRVKVGSNYQEHIQYIGTDKIDIAYMGPASYVQLVDLYGDKPLLARLEVNGHPYFQGNIIIRQDSNIKSLSNLKGKRIAFGDPNSTMSYLVPHHMLHRADAFIDTSLKHQFLNSHDNVAYAVLTGDFDAGAVKPAVFKKFKSKGLRTLAMTPKISEHLFVTSSTLPKDKIKTLRNVMLNMQKSKKGLSALHEIKSSITRLVKADNNDYENLRKIIIESRDFH